MLAQIALPSRPDFSIKNFVESLRQHLQGVAEVTAPQKINGKVQIKIDETTLEISASNRPIPLTNPRQVVQQSAAWLNGESSVPHHQSHLSFQALGSGNKPQLALQLTMVVLTALEQCPHAVVVYWETAGHLIPSSAFRAIGAELKNTSRLWVSVTTQSLATGVSIGHTRGLAAFGYREIETRNATVPPPELSAALNQLIDLQLGAATPIRNGDSPPPLENHAIVKYLNRSTFDLPGPVMSLQYRYPTALKHPTARQRGLVEPAAKTTTANTPPQGSSPWVLLIGGALALSIVAGVFTLVFLALGMLNQLATTDFSESQTRLQVAEELIVADQLGVGHGNSPDAMDLAESFSANMKVEHEQKFSQEPNSRAPMSENQFVTYCELNELSAAFVCYVPGYLNYDANGQRSLSEIAWKVAVEQALILKRAHVAVALMDGEQYCSVQTGRSEDASRNASGDSRELLVFFEPSATADDFPETKRLPENQAVANKDEQDGPVTNRQELEFQQPQISSQPKRRTPAETEPSRQDHNQQDSRAQQSRERRVAPSNRRRPQMRQPAQINSQSNPNSALKYRWRRNEKHRYRGEFVSERDGQKLAANIFVSYNVALANLIRNNGRCSESVVDAEGNSSPIREVEFAGTIDIDRKGLPIKYGGSGFLPLSGHPISMIPLIDLPKSSEETWTSEQDAVVQMVQVPTNAKNAAATETRLQYSNFSGTQDNSNRRSSSSGGRRGQSANDSPPPTAPQEQLLESIDVSERADYRISQRMDDRVTIECGYRLASKDLEQTPFYEVSYQASYVFSERLGVITELQLNGRIRHRSERVDLDSPFELTLKRLTPAELAREAQERARLRNTTPEQRQQQEMAERQLQAERAAQRKVESEKWLPANVVQRLKSKDLQTLREVFQGLGQNRVAPPNKEIALAIIEFLKNQHRKIRLSQSILEKWIDRETAPILLQELVNISDQESFVHSVTVMDKLETPGLVPRILKSLEVDHLRASATAVLERFDTTIEADVIAFLRKSRNEAALSEAVNWLGKKGTRKAMPKVRGLSRKTKDRQLLAACQSALRSIQVRNKR